MAYGHARLKKALVLRDALAHELGLDLAVVMRGLSTVEDTMTAELAMADGNYLAQLESLCRGDAALLTEADQVVRAAYASIASLVQRRRCRERCQSCGEVSRMHELFLYKSMSYTGEGWISDPSPPPFFFLEHPVMRRFVRKS